jgi:histidine triad (HIT) family protein
MDCLFCKFAQNEIKVDFVAENDRAFAINDINPVAPSHFLIIPKDHFENAGEMASRDPGALVGIFDLLNQLTGSLEIASYRTVFNTGGEAGQSIFHAHLHVLAGRPLQWPPG